MFDKDGYIYKAWGFVGALWRDFIAFLCYVRFQIVFKKITIFRETLTYQFDRLVEKIPNKTAIIYHGHRTRFIDLQKRSNQIANWVEQSLNLGLDDDKLPQIDDGSGATTTLQQHQIGLMLGNTPEMVAFMLGIARVRAASVLFNTNHRRDSLQNAIDATKCKVLIFDQKYLDAVQEIVEQLPEEMKFFMVSRKGEVNNNDKNSHYDATNYWQYGGIERADLVARVAVDNFASILGFYSDSPVEREYTYELSDNITYIFTSGTTGGTVKATPTNNVRYIVGFLSQSHAFSINMSDNIYISLPLYHSFPGVIGLGRCLLGGSTVTLTDKFSATKFWDDCRENQCTVALYIGEICRYLLAQPKRPNETAHNLRMMHGLGLNSNLWAEFTSRFKIQKVSEFYGSSEGNINLFNIMGKEGSCGFIPYYFGPFCRILFPIYLIKVDPNTLEPIRGSNGLCKLAYPGDVGLIVGTIKDHLPYTKFLGYTSEKETSKKILKNILRKGDYAFISGDLMEMDLYGNLYFKDRTGDTFRWKGENVSTTEVESIAAQFLEHQVCTVYGVSIPYTDGRAGMIAIKMANDASMSPSSPRPPVDLDEFHLYMKARVPEYAIPKFVRFTTQIETTSTHKLIKWRLREEGFNLSAIGEDDVLFYFDKSTSQYRLLNEESWRKIQQGLIRF